MRFLSKSGSIARSRTTALNHRCYNYRFFVVAMGRSRSRDKRSEVYYPGRHPSRRNQSRNGCPSRGGDDAEEEDDGIGSDLVFFKGYGEVERHIKVHGCSVAGKELVFTVPQNIDKICTIVWASSVVLAELVVTELRELCERGSTVLELGCGSAIPSMVAAFLGAKALATDQDLTSAETTLAKNQKTLAEAPGCVDLEKLDWGPSVPQHYKDVRAVLVADSLYKEECLVPLASQLAAIIAASSTPPRILLAYQRRDLGLENKFFGSVLNSEALCSRELSTDTLDFLSDDLSRYIKVVEIFPQS